MGKVRLKKGEEKRIKARHLWVFNNEIDKVSELEENGEIVEVFDHKENFVARGYFNKHSLISVRILTNDPNQEIDKNFLQEKIAKAYQYRKNIYPQLSSYRVIYSEGDLLPGLIVDKYENFLSVQILTLGMEKLKPFILEVLEELFQPEGVVLKNDSVFREMEGLKKEIIIVKGNFDAHQIIEEYGLKFYVDFLKGQKTGFFFDQRENRSWAASLSKNRKVLDCFCYSGGFALAAAKGGAKEVLGVDESEAAVKLAQENAKLNNFNNVTFQKQEVFNFLRKLNSAGEKFDMVILDPPAFVKSKEKLKEGIKGYKEINLQAMKLLNSDGILISCSCSYQLSKEDFLNMIKSAAADSGKICRLVKELSQAADHPILLSMPETQYLKGIILEVL
ncbi:MAG TPA: class I SAM-dependent rRNA methyltransferase [candidate division Zixibacteria bacterium]|nr:class I SAM-dependent rRNA methyltransferase [candidate division Zixibacteria bacterium]